MRNALLKWSLLWFNFTSILALADGVVDPFDTDAMHTNSQALCTVSPAAPYKVHSYQYVAMQGCAIILADNKSCPLPWSVIKQNAISGSVDSVCSHEANYENSVKSLQPFIQRDAKVCQATVTSWRRVCQ